MIRIIIGQLRALENNMKKLLALLLLSPLVVSEELESLYDYFDKNPYASDESELDLFLYSSDKCSAITFLSIGGDNPDVEDIGDTFMNQAYSIRKIKSPEVDIDTRWRNTQDSIQKYFKEYEAHFLDFRKKTNSEELFSDLMKSDLKFCLEILEAMADEGTE
jgi:hypothetical protein